MYIDAGTGSMLLQAGAAVFFSTAIFFKQILGYLYRSRKPAEDQNSKP